MTQQIRFGAFLLDTEHERLTKSGELIGLRPKAFLLLDYLARRPGELATKEALLDALWTGVHVSDAVLKVAIGELRRALGDSPRAPTLIETVHRRGYRFIGESHMVERTLEPLHAKQVQSSPPEATSTSILLRRCIRSRRRRAVRATSSKEIDRSSSSNVSGSKPRKGTSQQLW